MTTEKAGLLGSRAAEEALNGVISKCWLTGGSWCGVTRSHLAELEFSCGTKPAPRAPA
jgi:hypothetical protein